MCELYTDNCSYKWSYSLEVGKCVFLNKLIFLGRPSWLLV